MAKDKMWNGIGWYEFIGVLTTSTTDISLTDKQCRQRLDATECYKTKDMGESSKFPKSRT